ncbi:MAG: YkgJ family cysteine cluster protein [Nitrospira sp.]|nr:YkgJ family cysteine cluster protein [Nitrospira sp.]
MTPHSSERCEIALNTPAGRVTTAVDVPTALVPVTAIVPLMRRLGEEAHALEEARSLESGQARSCHRSCAACCRMLVPLSPPEAFSLREFVRSLPREEQERIAARLAHTKSVLLTHRLWNQLEALAESSQSPDDDMLEPINQAYYALRIPCPFLENDLCSIYDERPAACRELLVTSPAEQCQDMAQNPIVPIPAPVRIGPILGLLWGELTKTPPRLIPLPIALDWAERHQNENHQTWQGTQLLDTALDKVWRFLSQTFQQGGNTPPPNEPPV